MAGPDVPGALAQSPLRIHPAAPADVDAIMDVHVAGRSAYYRGFLPDEEIAADNALVRGNRDGYLGRIADPAFTVLCAELDRRVVGFVLAGPFTSPTRPRAPRPSCG